MLERGSGTIHLMVWCIQLNRNNDEAVEEAQPLGSASKNCTLLLVFKSDNRAHVNVLLSTTYLELVLSFGFQ